MNVWTAIVAHPGLYFSFAAAVSLYYGTRGWIISLHQKDAKWTLCETRYVNCVQDSIYNFVCGIAGFVALYEEVKLFHRVDMARVETGTAILIAFLGLLAILGVSGKLTETLHRGLLFGTK